jgi:hypothetical protein
METIYQFSLKAGEISIPEKEVYRYLGYMGHKPDEADVTRIAEGIKKTEALAAPKACYGLFDIEIKGENVVLPYGEIHSKSLAAWCEGCSRAYIFAATIGAAIDRQIKTASVRSMSEAAILQACGAACVEEFCNILNEKLNRESEEKGHKNVKRYSPGYGDLELTENQKGVFSILNPAKYIGLSLMDTCIMSPEKSVTAIIGVKE